MNRSCTLAGDAGVGSLPYQPAIYEDELLFSIIARMIRHTGWSNRYIAMYLYAPPACLSLRVSADFPTRLQNLCQKFGDSKLSDYEYILENHTLYPYYVSYSTETMAKKIRSKFLDVNPRWSGKNPIDRSARVRSDEGVGLLKFCEQCNDESFDKYGEYYWKRSHQLPAVSTCFIHKSLLKFSTVSIRNNNAYVAADKWNCPRNAGNVIGSRPVRSLDQLFDFADRSRRLLVEKIVDRDVDNLIRRRLMKLQQLQLATVGCTIRYELLAMAAKKYMGELIVHYPFLEISRQGWIHSLIYKNNNVNRPMLNLLFDFLIEKIEADSSRRLVVPVDPSKKYADLFDIRKWKCGNRITCCETRQQLSVIRIKNSSDELVATIRCECEFEFTVRRNKRGNFGKPRFKSVGSEVEKFIKDCGYMQFSLIAGRLNLCRASYARLVRRLKGEFVGNLC